MSDKQTDSYACILTSVVQKCWCMLNKWIAREQKLIDCFVWFIYPIIGLQQISMEVTWTCFSICTLKSFYDLVVKWIGEKCHQQVPLNNSPKTCIINQWVKCSHWPVTWVHIHVVVLSATTCSVLNDSSPVIIKIRLTIIVCLVLFCLQWWIFWQTCK